MSKISTTRRGQFAVQDSGAPNPSSDEEYTTLVLVHGFAWHGGIFNRLLPLASVHNARIILINRRDYPGSSTLMEAERQALDSPPSDDEKAASGIELYMKERAYELYGFLEAFVCEEQLSLESIIVAGWSFGSAWITALLAYASTFPTKHGISLARYIKHALIYDPPYHAVGYPPPEPSYHPFADPSISPAESVKAFLAWVSGYYTHGDSASSLEYRSPVNNPRPTLLTMTEEDNAMVLEEQPASPAGSDGVLLRVGVKYGVFKVLRERALFGYTLAAEATGRGDIRAPISSSRWANVPVRYLWCDRSCWEAPWGAWSLIAEIAETKASGRTMRKVIIQRLKGANHFVHWDEPERALKVLLADEGGDYE